MGNKLYFLIRSPQKVRESGMAVERATSRLAEILQVSREALVPHKRNRSIMLAPGPTDATMTAIAE
eukprot:338202-Alexandrium_andersonii.AAC.1